MRKQDHLPGLIASLSANEKRQFRLFAAQQQDDTGYLKLFDALDGSEQYNATDICNALGISKTQLNQTKNYLAKVLLKSLRQSKDGISVKAYLTNCILEIEELTARRQYDYAIEMADKALAYSDEKGHSFFVQAICHQKLNIMLMTGDLDEVAAIEHRMKDTLLINSEHVDLHILMSFISQFERSRKDPAEFLYHDRPMLHIDPEALHSDQAVVGWFALMNHYHLAARKDPETIAGLARRNVEVFEKNERLKKNFGSAYMQSWGWLVSCESAAGNYDKAWEATERALQIVSTHGRIFVQTALDFIESMRSSIAFSLGKYALSLSLAEELYTGRKQQDDYARFALLMYYAKALMHNGRSADAVDRLDELLLMDSALRTDLQPYIRPMMILAQLDLGNHKIVPYLIKSARSWMKRQKISNPEIEAFLSHAYTVAKTPLSKRNNQWQKLIDTVAKGDLPRMEKELHLARLLQEFA